jgi:hypothetical protein
VSFFICLSKNEDEDTTVSQGSGPQHDDIDSSLLCTMCARLSILKTRPLVLKHDFLVSASTSRPTS